jgi:transcriptional regulator with XRE-family HTH domain
VDDGSRRRDPARHREIGSRVAYWRKRRNLTRKQFADLCGRSVSWVDKVEAGERSLLRLPMLERVAEVLNISAKALTGEMKAKPAEQCFDLFEVKAIREALQRYQAITTVFRPPNQQGPPNLTRLSQQVTYAWTSFQNARYPTLGRILPSLLQQAQDVVLLSSNDDERLAARVLLSQTYQVTASALWKVKETDLAWLAAERGLSVAEQTGDSLLISDAARRVAQCLMATDHHSQALELLQADIDRLKPALGAASPEHLSLYGMLFLLGGVVAARCGRAAAARDLLAEGGTVAARLGADRNERFTAFGPTNVLLHQVAALLDLGDGGAAVEVAGRVNPDGLVKLPRERRANFLVDNARGLAQQGSDEAAVAALWKAPVLAPDEIRCRPIAAGLIHDIWRRQPGKPFLTVPTLAISRIDHFRIARNVILTSQLMYRNERQNGA